MLTHANHNDDPQYITLWRYAPDGSVWPLDYDGWHDAHQANYNQAVTELGPDSDSNHDAFLTRCKELFAETDAKFPRHIQIRFPQTPAQLHTLIKRWGSLCFCWESCPCPDKHYFHSGHIVAYIMELPKTVLESQVNG